MLALKCGTTVVFCHGYTHKSTHISIIYLTVTVSFYLLIGTIAVINVPFIKKYSTEAIIVLTEYNLQYAFV